MTFDFTTPKSETRNCTKWANLQPYSESPPAADALGMWVAQMDFLPAPVLQDALAALRDEGEYGYFPGLDSFQNAVRDWHEMRFGWTLNPDHVLPTHGIGNAIGLTLQALTNPGDAVIIFTPVYNEFLAKLQRNEREIVQSKLKVDSDGFFQLDLETLETQLSGRERMMLISSPHNPAGRVWTSDELRAMADFCVKHDLLLASDEIHQDLVFSGHKHVPTALAAPQIASRLIVMSAASKTFDIAGFRTGYVTIPDDELRARFRKLHHALDIQVNRAGFDLTKAVYSAAGAAWVDELVKVLEDNASVLSEAVNAIPGMHAMPMQGTYLSWIDFTDTGMTRAEFEDRMVSAARLITSPGPLFGTGGENAQRINIGTTRARVEEAADRMLSAFSDLQ